MSTFVNTGTSTYDFLFRITGKHSIERLEPLLYQLFEETGLQEPIHLMDDDLRYPAFVWETTCKKEWRESHHKAQVLNKLHNTHILESKSAMAFLQLRMQGNHKLETFVANSTEEVYKWFESKWPLLTSDDLSNHGQNSFDSHWWVIKASKGNGGRDVWIVSHDKWRSIVDDIPGNQEYVIQRYVNNPILYQGKKFHFRCYTMMWADGTAMMYQMAYILTAGFTYDCSDLDIRKHVTNLSINKRIPGYPGQVPCHLPTEYPEIYNSIKTIWSDVVDATKPFLANQRNPFHFEFFGIDVIADCAGRCWLIEINRLPGLESSSLNTSDEDIMYNVMMYTLLKMVLKPICGSKSFESSDSYVVNPSLSIPMGLVSSETGMWDLVSSAFKMQKHTKGTSDNKMLGSTCLNLMNWRAFTKKNWHKVHAMSNMPSQDD